MSIQKIKTAWHLYRALFSYGWKDLKGGILVSVICGIIGLLLQGAGITLALYSGNILMKGSTISLLGFSFNPQSSLPFLIVVSTLCFALFLASAFLNFYYQKRPIQLSCQLERRFIDLFIERMQSDEYIRPPKTPGVIGEGAFIKICLTDSRACSRAFLLLIWAVAPLVTAIVAVFILLYLQPLLSVMLTPVIFIYLFFLFSLNKSGMQNAKELEVTSAEIRKFLRGALSEVGSSNQVEGRYSKQDSEEIDRYLTAYSNVVSLSYRSFLLSDILLGVTVSLVLFGLSAWAMFNHDKWVILATYLVSLRYTVHGSKLAFARLTQANRFTHHITRALNFLKSSGSTRTCFQSPKTIQIGELSVSRGNPVVLYSRQRITKLSIHEILDSIVRNNTKRDPHKVIFVNDYTQVAKLATTSADWVILSSSVLSDITVEQFLSLLSKAHDKFILIYEPKLIVLKDLSRLNQLEVSVVVLGTRNQIVWSGSFSDFKKVRSDLVPAFLEPTQVGKTSSEADIDDLDLIA